LWISDRVKKWFRENYPRNDAVLHASIISYGIENNLEEINSITICKEENFDIVKSCLKTLHPELKNIFPFEKTEGRKNSYAHSTAKKIARNMNKINNIHRNKGYDVKEVDWINIKEKMDFLIKSGRQGTIEFNHITLK